MFHHISRLIVIRQYYFWSMAMAKKALGPPPLFSRTPIPPPEILAVALPRFLSCLMPLLTTDLLPLSSYSIGSCTWPSLHFFNISPDVVKSEESLEKQIEVLLHYFNPYHDPNAALKIIKLESLIIERDSIKLEQIDAPSSQEMSSTFSEATGSNISHNEEKGCYSDKESDYADDKSNSSDESCTKEERNPSSSNKKLSTVYQCGDCSYHTSKVSQFKCYRNSHTGENPLSCSNCSYTTSKKNDLIQHQLSHSGTKPFSCKECSYKATKKDYLIKHQLKHSGFKRFSCSECPYKMTRKNDLKNHLLTHSGIKPFSCNECSFSTNYKGNLIKHQLIHSGLKAFSCGQCSYKTKKAEFKTTSTHSLLDKAFLL